MFTERTESGFLWLAEMSHLTNRLFIACWTSAVNVFCFQIVLSVRIITIYFIL